MDYNVESIKLHNKLKGKIEIVSKKKISSKKDLSLLYTPGVGAVSLEIYKDFKKAKQLTSSKNTIAIITDGSAVLGLGDIGPLASLPVMEGKAALFKEFAGVDAFPITIDSKDTEEIIKTVKLISKSYGGINLEDIAAPRCFEIENRLKKELDIPVFHDDQHGTAIVVLSALINALKVTKKDKNSRIVINGAGAAGLSITKLLHAAGFMNILVCDSKGIISNERKDLNSYKKEILDITNKENISGNLLEAIKNADIFIGASKGNLLTSKDILTMNQDSIIFALANPTPEIFPTDAKKGKAKIIATGRSDFENQINNVLVFPGLFKALLKYNVIDISQELKIDVSKAIAGVIKKPTEKKIIPSVLDKKVIKEIDKAVSKYKI
jgi:malate dehydrogenase (oxaloacetate-decarboxylating)